MRHAIGHITSEGEYFHQLDAEKIQDIQRRADPREQRRRHLGEACHIDDPRLLSALEELGYHATTIPLLCLVPPLQVAWSDGSISHSVRERIKAAAADHGVASNSPAYYQLLVWLERRPPDEFFEGTLRVIQAILEGLPPDERKARKDGLLQCCADVASAHSGLLGKMCAAKRQLLGEIERRLEPRP